MFLKRPHTRPNSNELSQGKGVESLVSVWWKAIYSYRAQIQRRMHVLINPSQRLGDRS